MQLTGDFFSINVSTWINGGDEMEGQPMYMKPRPLARYTGISEDYIRRGLRAEKIAHIRSGRDFLVNVPLFLEQMEIESKKGVSA